MVQSAQKALEEYFDWTLKNIDKLDDDELWKIIEIFFGFRIPRKAVCENHCAPFDFVADAFFERVNNMIVLANRNGGKTQDFGILNALDLLYKGCEVASVGAVLDQAEKCYSYTLECLQRPIVEKYLKTYLRSKTQTSTGGLLQILAGTLRGVNGPHPQKANLDEVDLMDWAVIQEAISMPKSRSDAKASLRITSTRKFINGAMQRLLDEAQQRGLKIYQWCIWEVIEPCPDERSGTVPVYLNYLPYGAKDDSKRETVQVFTHDEGLRNKTVRLEDIEDYYNTNKFSGCLNCPLCSVCQTKAKRSDGFFSIDDACNRFLNLDREVWNAQWECHKPGREGLVYSEFGDQNIKDFEINPEWKIYAGQDFGFTNPSVAIFLAVDGEENIYVFDEDYATQTPITSLIDNVYIPYAKKYNVQSWYCDPSGADAIATMQMRMQKHGVTVMPALTNNIDAGINVVRYFIRTPNGQRKLFVHPRCENLLKDFSTYRYKDGTDKPEKDLGDHGMDALRYALVSLFPALLADMSDSAIVSDMPYPDYNDSTITEFTQSIQFDVDGYFSTSSDNHPDDILF